LNIYVILLDGLGSFVKDGCHEIGSVLLAASTREDARAYIVLLLLS
jgi:hypothetical protein